MDDEYWMPKAAFPLWEMPVPCPDCASATFDNMVSSIVCSDCGWTMRAANGIGMREPGKDWHRFCP